MRSVEEIIQDAKNNNDLKDYNLLEIHLYLCIEQILKMYANNQISKEDANRRKQIATKRYEDYWKQYEFESEMFKEHIEASNKSCDARMRLHKLLKEDSELTNEKMGEIINVCMEIISICFKGEF